jgi:Dolichyl-phosphate-mannose-protein mannosyltransferase
MSNRGRSALFLLIISAFFACAGIVFIRYPGLQNDELFFAPPIFVPQTAFYAVRAFGAQIPLMVMSYTGALKTWIYAGVFSLWEPSRWSVRIPVLFVCLATIWLTWIWARMAAGKRVAIAAVALLGTDSLFLLSGVLDWGPVALQHLLMMSGLVAVTYFAKSGTRFALGLGFFLWGLGLWDKALMIWLLMGFAVAVICVYPRELKRRLSPATVAIALGAFVIGAAPLIWYNVDRHGETATANAAFSTDSYILKLKVLGMSLDGSSLFAYLVDADAATPQRPPRGVVERVAFAIHRGFGTHKENWFLPALALAVISLPLLRRSRLFRPMAFLLIASVVAWAQMFMTHNAGGGAHHAVLLWPMPILLVSMAIVAAAEAFPRYGSAVFVSIVSLLVIGNLLNENEYLTHFAIRGGIGGWTDAIYPLSGSLDDATWVGTVDWGYANGLRVLHKGHIKLFNTSDYMPKTQGKSASIEELKGMVGNPGLLFVQHTESKQLIPHVNDALRSRAEVLGYTERLEQRIRDSSGDPVFEIFRFERSPGGAHLAAEPH